MVREGGGLRSRRKYTDSRGERSPMGEWRGMERGGQGGTRPLTLPGSPAVDPCSARSLPAARMPDPL